MNEKCKHCAARIFSICFVLLGLLAAVLYEIFHSPTDIR